MSMSTYNRNKPLSEHLKQFQVLQIPINKNIIFSYLGF